MDVFIENLEFLPLIQSQIGFATGTGSVNVTIGGQVDAPQLKGIANFADVAFNLPDANIHVKNTGAAVDFTHEGFEIRNCGGVLNGGVYRAGGSGSSNWHRIEYVDLEAALDGGSTFEQRGLYRVTCGEVDVSMTGPVGGGESGDSVTGLPPVQGTVRIAEGTYERHWQDLVNELFDESAKIQFEVWSDYPIMRDLRFDLEVLAPDNFSVISNLGELDVEVSIDGKFSGRIQQPLFIGRIDLMPRSEFKLKNFTYRFTIEEGSYVQNTNLLEFNPWYEIYAKTLEPIEGVPVVTTDGAAHTRDVEISAHLSGYLKQEEQRHKPQFYANVLGRGAGETYDLSRAHIISILTTGDAALLGTSPFDASVPLLVRPSEQFIGDKLAQLFGMDKARVGLSSTGSEKPRWLLSREIFERLLVTVNSTYQIHAEPRIEVEYRIRRGFSVTGERSEQGKYGVDLKLEQRF